MRPYHSTSSISLAKRCPHAWAQRYLAGLREPRVTWEDIEAGKPDEGQRSSALGTAMHSVGDAWYTPGATPNWAGLPGQIFESGTHLLPHPDACTLALPEAPIGAVPLVIHTDGSNYWARRTFEPAPGVRQVRDAEGVAAARAMGVPTHALDVSGVLWAGFRDLLANSPEELARLGVDDVAGGWLQVDYKSTADIKRYSLTAKALRSDLQAGIYTVDACRMLGVKRIPSRWAYFETKRVRRASAVDVVISLDQALEVVEPACTFARELDKIERVQDASKNPRACGDYGRTCFYHQSRGGPCDARRSIGGLVQARVKKTDEGATMPLTKEQQAKFDAMKKKAQAAAATEESEESAAAAATEESEESADETEAEEETETEAETKPAPKKFGGAKPGGAAKAKPGPKKAAGGSSLRELVDQLEATEALAAELKAQIAAAVA